MKIPLLALLIQGVPESISVTTLAFVVAKAPLRWEKIVFIGLIISFSAYILRLFPITFGIHTVILMGLLFIFLIKFGNCGVITALKASLVSELILVFAESGCLSLLMFFTGFTFEEFINNTFLRIAFTLPQVFVIFFVAFIIYRIRLTKEIQH